MLGVLRVVALKSQFSRIFLPVWVLEFEQIHFAACCIRESVTNLCHLTNSGQNWWNPQHPSMPGGAQLQLACTVWVFLHPSWSCTPAGMHCEQSKAMQFKGRIPDGAQRNLGCQCAVFLHSRWSEAEPGMHCEQSEAIQFKSSIPDGVQWNLECQCTVFLHSRWSGAEPGMHCEQSEANCLLGKQL